MKTKTKILPGVLWVLIGLAIAVIGVLLLVKFGPYGFARAVSEDEKALRLQIVNAAEGWLGHNEADGSHEAIIDLYNSHTPLAQGYEVQYDDDWCSTFASAMAVQCGLTDIIPTECGCERHTKLFMEMDCWVEDDSYVPLPGDYIFYCWSDKGVGDCTGWSNHVGIVVGTLGPFIKVIEGNHDDEVKYRIITVDAITIRGYGTPDYSA